MRAYIRLGLLVMVIGAMLVAGAGTGASPGTTERVSVDSAGVQADGSSALPAISGDGRYVVFSSWASNLVPEDTNGLKDVFVHDRQTGVTERVSVDSAGNQANGESNGRAISGDGRYVAFESEASNLVPGDTSTCAKTVTNWPLPCADIFVHDRQTGATERVSVDSAGNQGNDGSRLPAISADGRYVAFSSIASNLVAGDTNTCAWGEVAGMCEDIFVHDRQTGVTLRVSVDSVGNEGNGPSSDPFISADGRYVAFSSTASNLVAGDTNVFNDVFVHDRQTGATERVSVDSAGNEGNSGSGGPAISADGRYVAFSSIASNLVSGDTNKCPNWPSSGNPGECRDVFVHDCQTGVTVRVSVDSAGNEGNDLSDDPAISADGRYVAFHSEATNLMPDDTNEVPDIFVHDRQTGVTERISVDSGGNQANSDSYHPAISADGRYVAFHSEATNLMPDDTNGATDVFVHDRSEAPTPPPTPSQSPLTPGLTQRVSVDSASNQGNNESRRPAISADGRYIAFESEASNLVVGDTNDGTDIFVHDHQTGATERVSVDSAGNQGNDESQRPAISADGRYVAFGSIASNLVVGDTNDASDIFVHDRQTGVTERVSVHSADGEANGPSSDPAISADGRYVAFASGASNLVSGDTGAMRDVFVHDRQTGATVRVSVDSAGNQGNGGSEGPAISADGRYVAFVSGASNLTPEGADSYPDVLVHDRDTDEDGIFDETGAIATELVKVGGPGHNENPAMSADGRYIAFDSELSGSMSCPLPGYGYGEGHEGCTSVFIYDRQTGVSERVSVRSIGDLANRHSYDPAISADGRYVAFYSEAFNLVVGDTNGKDDVFVRDRQTRVTKRVSVDSAGNQANGGSYSPTISADGRYVAFYSWASNLVLGDTNDAPDVFVHDRGEAPTSGQLTVCPEAGKWAISVWDGPSGTATGDALATCADVSIDAAYWLDPASQGWSRYFPGLLDISDLLTLDALQPIIIHGS